MVPEEPKIKAEEIGFSRRIDDGACGYHESYYTPPHIALSTIKLDHAPGRGV
jgi:hypothetical protein